MKNNGRIRHNNSSHKTRHNSRINKNLNSRILLYFKEDNNIVYYFILFKCFIYRYNTKGTRKHTISGKQF